MREFLRINPRLKMLSLLFALAAWSYLRFVDNPLLPNQSMHTFTVPITVTGLRTGARVSLEPQSATITLSSPLDRSNEAERPRVLVDLSAYRPGRYHVPLQVRSDNSGVSNLAPGNVLAEISTEKRP